MIIKNPNGYIKNSKEINISKLPMSELFKTGDIMITYNIVDGSTLYQRIPISSLRKVSKYASKTMKNHLYLEDITKILQNINDIIESTKKIYSTLSIKIISHKINFIEGDSNDI